MRIPPRMLAWGLDPRSPLQQRARPQPTETLGYMYPMPALTGLMENARTVRAVDSYEDARLHGSFDGAGVRCAQGDQERDEVARYEPGVAVAAGRDLGRIVREHRVRQAEEPARLAGIEPATRCLEGSRSVR